MTCFKGSIEVGERKAEEGKIKDPSKRMYFLQREERTGYFKTGKV